MGGERDCGGAAAMKTINGWILLRPVGDDKVKGGILLPTPTTELLECAVVYNAFDYTSKEPVYFANSKVFVRRDTKSHGTYGHANLYRLGDIVAGT